jgi:hypothetical protein
MMKASCIIQHTLVPNKPDQLISKYLAMASVDVQELQCKGVVSSNRQIRACTIIYTISLLYICYCL